MEKKNYPLVSVVTINYNQSGITAQCLESLKRITYPQIEILVVDNASQKEDASWLQESYPDIIFIQSEKNLGFAGGNNLGIKRAQGEYILLLNNDTEVEPSFLEPLVQKFFSHPETGAVSPKIKYYHRPDVIQYAGLTSLQNFMVRNQAIGYNQLDNGQFDEDRETSYGHGAALLVSRKVIEKVGLMANIFFLYYEELDWCYRIWQAGYKIYYVHNSVVWHKESVSIGLLSPMQVYYKNRGRILYMRRNTSGKNHFLAAAFILFVSVPKNYFYFTTRRQWSLLKAYHNSVMWHFKNLFNKKIKQSPHLA